MSYADMRPTVRKVSKYQTSEKKPVKTRSSLFELVGKGIKMHTILLSYIVVLQLFRLSSADLTMYFHGKRINETAADFVCRLSDAPVGDTVEFLVNDITAFNIRIYGDDCYITDSQLPCDKSKCKCHPDGKRYEWVYLHMANVKYKAACRAKKNNRCFVDVELTMDADVDNHNLKTKNCDTSAAIPNPTASSAKNPTSSLSITKGDAFLIESCLVSFFWLNHRETPSLSFFLVTAFHFSMAKAKQTKVVLTVEYKKGHINLVCKVRNLVNEVYFHDPKGHQRGFCTAPVPTIAPGVCEEHMIQNIDNNTTLLVTSNTNEDKGMWTCFHGINTHENDFVIVDFDVDRYQTIENKAIWLGIGISIGFVVGLLPCLFFVVCNRNRKKQKPDDTTTLDLNEQNESNM